MPAIQLSNIKLIRATRPRRRDHRPILEGHATPAGIRGQQQVNLAVGHRKPPIDATRPTTTPSIEHATASEQDGIRGTSHLVTRGIMRGSRPTGLAHYPWSSLGDRTHQAAERDTMLHQARIHPSAIPVSLRADTAPRSTSRDPPLSTASRNLAAGMPAPTPAIRLARRAPGQPRKSYQRSK